jgi:drug/metabolite transporter (DMT)-like permease
VNHRRADLALIGNTVIWGATFTLVKVAIGSVSPILFLALRFSLATAALAVFFRLRGGGAPSFEAAPKPLAGYPLGPVPNGPGSDPSHECERAPYGPRRATRENEGAAVRSWRAAALGRVFRGVVPGLRPAKTAGLRPEADESVGCGPGGPPHAAECAVRGVDPGRTLSQLPGPSWGLFGTASRRRSVRWWPGALTGVFLFCGYSMQTQGLRFTTAPKSAFLTGLASVMVPLLGALVYKTRPQISEVVGVLVAIAGLGLMTLQGAVGSIGRGDLLTLLGALGFAAHIVALGHFSEHMSFEFLSVMQVGTAAVLSLGLCWWVERPHVEWRPVVVCAILITGFLATALAFTVQAWAQQFTTSTRTALIYMLEPVFAWITSYVWAGENLTGRAAVGAVLILGGVMLVEMKPLFPRLHPSQ